VSKEVYRTVRSPRHRALEDPASVSRMLLKHRFLNVKAAKSGASKKVIVHGLGVVVVRKETASQGKTRTIITVDGKEIGKRILAKKASSPILRELFGLKHGKG
jgi:hypothetical protein